MSSNFVRVTTSTAPVNIAVVKYCELNLKHRSIQFFCDVGNCVSAGGKRDDHLILPINDSLSLTLNSDEVERNSNQFMLFVIHYSPI